MSRIVTLFFFGTLLAALGLMGYFLYPLPSTPKPKPAPTLSTSTWEAAGLCWGGLGIGSGRSIKGSLTNGRYDAQTKEACKKACQESFNDTGGKGCTRWNLYSTDGKTVSCALWRTETAQLHPNLPGLPYLKCLVAGCNFACGPAPSPGP